MTDHAKTGRCLCGAVRYRAHGPLRPVVACHCSQCRRASGHHVAATACARPALEIAGEVRWYRSSPDGLSLARHIFCAEKGDYYEIRDDLPKADDWE